MFDYRYYKKEPKTILKQPNLKLKIFKISIVTFLFLIIFGGIFPIFVKGVSELILNDEFSSQSNYWYYRDYEGTAILSIENSLLNLTITAESNDSVYSNCEIYDANNSLPYLYNFVEFRIKLTSNTSGSRGWGFWNGNLDPDLSESVWFTYVQGNDSYPFSGLYAVSENDHQDQQMVSLNHVNFTEWNNYSIDWQPTCAVFRVNGEIVANFTSNFADVNTRIDIWIDNAIYDLSTYNHIYQNISEDTSLLVDYVRIYSENPYSSSSTTTSSDSTDSIDSIDSTDSTDSINNTDSSSTDNSSSTTQNNTDNTTNSTDNLNSTNSDNTISGYSFIFIITPLSICVVIVYQNIEKKLKNIKNKRN